MSKNRNLSPAVLADDRWLLDSMIEEGLPLSGAVAIVARLAARAGASHDALYVLNEWYCKLERGDSKRDENRMLAECYWRLLHADIARGRSLHQLVDICDICHEGGAEYKPTLYDIVLEAAKIS